MVVSVLAAAVAAEDERLLQVLVVLAGNVDSSKTYNLWDDVEVAERTLAL
jgi:hypothetical protein